jgi:hypothetical protein
MDETNMKFPVGAGVVYAPSKDSIQRAGYVGEQATVAGHYYQRPGEFRVIIAFPSGTVFPVPEYDLMPAWEGGR